MKHHGIEDVRSMMKRLGNRLLAKEKSEIEDGETAGKEDLMEAMVAACAAVAFADGSLDIRERRRIFFLMQTTPSFAVFSHAEVAAEFERHAAAFELDPVEARREALVTIRSMEVTSREVKLILDACQQVLEADGVKRPEEFSTLAEVRAALTQH
jgi:tellurite resistance protein TerB